MANGGYVLVDCTGVDLLAQSSVTVSGLFAKCKAAYESGKPVYAVNAEYGEGVPMTPIQVMGIYQGGQYCFSASILQIWVDDKDAVTIVPLISSNAKKSSK